MSKVEVRVTLLDGSTREFKSLSDYYDVKYSLTLHSHDDQPAYEDYYNDGIICYQEWRKEGKRHREGGLPAIISYNSDGVVYWGLWYKEGTMIAEEEAKKEISNDTSKSQSNIVRRIHERV